MKIVTLAGNVTKDAELKRTQTGEPLATFSLAVDDGYGENRSTMFFDVTIFGKRGQSLQPHITKGSKLTVIGELGKREHDGKTYLTVRASEVALQGGNTRAATPPAAYENSKRTAPAQSPAFDDDIPFAPEWR